MDYFTVFEVTDKGFEMITLIPLLFVIIGFGISWFNIKFNKSKSRKRENTILFGFIFGGFSLIILMLTLPSSLAHRIKVKKIYENKEYRVVEGEIEKFHPMPISGHDVESFMVDGIYFKYSDYRLVHGFNNTSSHGGPIKKNGQKVRLSYINLDDENIILKIELKKEYD